MEISLAKPLHIAVLLATTTLVACGGDGGGGGGSKPAPTPSSVAASLAASSNVVASQTAVSSTIVQSSAISQSSAIEQSSAISQSSTISQSSAIAQSSVVVQSSTGAPNHPASSNAPQASSKAPTSIAASSARVVDRSPDAVTFNNIADAEVNQPYTSNTVTVNGVEEPVAISITGGRYSKNGGAYTSEVGTITNGDTLTLEVMSSAKKEDTNTATVTIGTLSASFSVKTELDREPPVATFSFPTPYTMATGETLTVRGTASDDIEIESVTLYLTDKEGEEAPEIVEAKHLDVDYQPNAPKFSNWKATVPLYDESETEIVVVAKDINGNEIKIDDGDKVVVRERTDYSVAFPEERPDTGTLKRLSFDADTETLYHGEGYNTGKKIFKTDVKSAATSVYFEYPTENPKAYYLVGKGGIKDGTLYYIMTSNDSSDGNKKSIDALSTTDNSTLVSNTIPDDYVITHAHVDGKTNSLIISRNVDSGLEWIIEKFELKEGGYVDLDSKTVIYKNRTTDQLRTQIKSVVYVSEIGKLFFPDFKHKSVISVDVDNGAITTVSSNSIGEGVKFNTDNFGIFGNVTGLETILYNSLTNKLILSEALTGKIFEVDIETGLRKVIVDIGFHYIDPDEDSHKKVVTVNALYLDERRHVMYAAQDPTESLLVVDPVLGGQVILSKGINTKYQ